MRTIPSGVLLPFCKCLPHLKVGTEVSKGGNRLSSSRFGYEPIIYIFMSSSLLYHLFSNVLVGLKDGLHDDFRSVGLLPRATILTAFRPTSCSATVKRIVLFQRPKIQPWDLICRHRAVSPRSSSWIRVLDAPMDSIFMTIFSRLPGIPCIPPTGMPNLLRFPRVPDIRKTDLFETKRLATATSALVSTFLKPSTTV